MIKSDSHLYRKIRERIAVLDVFFLMNPPLLFPLWIMVLSGFSAAAAVENREIYWVANVSWRAIFLLSGVTLLAGAILIRHQIRSRKADAINDKPAVAKETDLIPENVRKLTTVLTVSGLILVLGTSLVGSSLTAIFWAVLLYFAWGILHDDRRFLWGGKPILSQISHALASLSLFMLGWTHVSGDVLSGLISSVPYLLAFLSWTAMSSVSDLRGDRAAGNETIAVRFGARSTLVWGTLVLSISTFLGYLYGDPVISTASAVSLPFFLVALVFSRTEHIQRAVRYPVFILAVFVSVRYPLFFLVLALMFYFSKYYYYFRLNVDYPTFHVVPE